MRDKITSLLGFAVKAGKLVYGSDNIEFCRRKLYLIIACDSLSVNGRERLQRLAAARKTPMLKCLSGLSTIVGKINCKAVALTDRQMAAAMLANLSENYLLIDVEEN